MHNGSGKCGCFRVGLNFQEGCVCNYFVAARIVAGKGAFIRFEIGRCLFVCLFFFFFFPFVCLFEVGMTKEVFFVLISNYAEN